MIDMSAFNHPQPGTTIRVDIIEFLGLSVDDAAEKLGVSPVALIHVLNGQSAISPVLASCLEQAGFSTARFWLALQAEYDRTQL